MEHTSIILYCNSEISYIEECINSIRSFTEPGTYEIIAIVNSNASEESIDWFTEQTDIVISSCKDNAKLQEAWNGVIHISRGDQIVFLHSNTVVTENWLTNLMQCLFVSEDIAVVGPLTNYFTGDNQMIDADYSTMNDLLIFANEQYRNGLVNGFFEKKLVISDFCFLIKRSALNKVGPLDEELEPKSFMKDYCLRLLEAGYKSALCKSVYVHHYSQLQENNSGAPLFYDKWSFDPQSTLPAMDLLAQLKPKGQTQRILMVGCGCGSSLMKLSNLYPEAEVYGIETDDVQRYLASLVGDVGLGSFSEQLSRFERRSFDHILVTPQFFEASHPLKSLKLMLDYLHEDGEFIIELANNRSCEAFRILFSEEVTSKHYGLQPSLSDISIFIENNSFYQPTVATFEKPLDDRDIALFNQTKSLMSPVVQQQFHISKFIMVARRLPETSLLHTLFNDLITAYTEEKLERILQYYPSPNVKAIEIYNGPAIPLLNLLAIESLERKKYDDALLYLNKAYELEPMDSSTLFNLGTLTYVLGDTEDSLRWLKQVHDKNEEVQQWIIKMEVEISQKSEDLKLLKLLLLRVEYNVERENNITEISERLRNKIVRVEDVLSIVEDDIIDKSNTLNLVAVHCYQKDQSEPAVTLLNKSLEYDPDFEPTILHLAFVHIQNGNLDRAYHYLKSANKQTPAIYEWLQKVKHSLDEGVQ
ncbi:glycosyltransferase [Paenibacillus crassostreae]|uniref:Glycosyltransferase 2-like domain-containing protein n=1 Tax=Paenibacillus crassostreae TaxID=1763538 RepID=A0A167D8M1_9BACL|nr:glycosyltransferase [Paenibacillus crassostreae]AOZ93249.1 hypothetical protein LPB68_14210 [Paenibacillus crassostreae]OAB74072.1 hypothetical protein PNBC_13050 [Paenibacillus crassostreae]